jgi:hypothetical protein
MLDGVIMGWLDWLFGRRVSTDAATLATRQSLAETPSESVVMGQFPNSNAPIMTTNVSMSEKCPSFIETQSASISSGQFPNFIVNTVCLPPDDSAFRILNEEMRAIATREAEEAKANAAVLAHAERLAKVPKYPRTRDCYHPNYRTEYNAVAVHIAEYPTDRYLTNLCEEFRNAEVERQRAIVGEYAGYEDLRDFALRMANKAIRERSAECVLNGMTALCIESERSDPRENVGCSEALRAAADMIGPQVSKDCFSPIVGIAERVPCNIGVLTRAVQGARLDFDCDKRWLFVKIVAGFRQFVYFE